MMETKKRLNREDLRELGRVRRVIAPDGRQRVEAPEERRRGRKGNKWPK